MPIPFPEKWRLALISCMALIVVVTPAVGAAPEEPTGYRKENYRAVVPASLNGATTVDTGQAKNLQAAGDVTLIDVLPYTPKPANLPAGTLWRNKERAHIRGSIWLANVGYGTLPDAGAEWFQKQLAMLSDGDKSVPFLFYCLRDCWMSWNAAKRALSYGYQRVYWYPDGTDGWEEANLPLVPATPRFYRQPATTDE